MVSVQGMQDISLLDVHRRSRLSLGWRRLYDRDHLESAPTECRPLAAPIPVADSFILPDPRPPVIVSVSGISAYLLNTGEGVNLRSRKKLKFVNKKSRI